MRESTKRNYNVYMIDYVLDGDICCEKFYTQTPQQALDEFCKWDEITGRGMELKAIWSYDNEEDRRIFKHKIAWVEA